MQWSTGDRSTIRSPGLAWGVWALVALVGCVPPTAMTTVERELALVKLEEALAAKSSASAPQVSGNAAELSATGNRSIQAEQPRPLLAELLQRIDVNLEYQRKNRRLDASVNAAWQIMHGVVCYGTALEIITLDQGQVKALEYAFGGGAIHGFEISLGSEPLPATGRTGIRARVEPGSYIGQGHSDQWLAICAMAEVPRDTQVHLGGTTRTLLDWCRQAQADVSQNLLEEFSWTLIALTYYLPDEPSWTTSDGLRLDWESLVGAELGYDLDSSPCGGTHRLSGIVRAVAAKERLNLPDTQVWLQATERIQACIDNAKNNRSSDGSLSSYYFVRPSKTVDIAAELASAGHLFEFLALAVPEQELAEPWMQLAATRLCEALESTQAVEMECGALYHALHGLKIYRQRHR